MFYLVLSHLGGQKLDYKRFITGRIVKLGSSVWPFLIMLATLYLLFHIHFEWLDLILNFFFLGYLGELPGNEHLWFLTVLMACYAEMILLINFRPAWKWFPWVFLVIMEGLMIGSEMNGLPGHTFSFLGLYGFVFLLGKECIRESKKLSLWNILAIVAINILHLWLCYHGLFEKSRPLTFLLSDVCGLSLLMLMLRYLPDNSNRIIGFISGISFEIYIVRHTLCAGPFLRVTHWPYGYVLDFLIMTGIAVVLAVGLNMISKRLSGALQSLFSLTN